MKNEWKCSRKRDEINLCHRGAAFCYDVGRQPIRSARAEINKKFIRSRELIVEGGPEKKFETANNKKSEKEKLMNNSLKYVRYKSPWITDIRISSQSCRRQPDNEKFRGWEQ